MKKILMGLIVCPVVALLAGCATPNVPLSARYWHRPHRHTVKVAVTDYPRAYDYKEGAQGLGDVALSDLMTLSLSRYLKTYQPYKFSMVRQGIVRAFRQHHIKASVYPNTISIKQLKKFKLDQPKKYGKQDFTLLAAKINSHYLLLLSIDALGTIRPYYGFIPLGAPKGYCVGQGRLIDLKTNKILWRYHADSTAPVEGKWDQPPKYPNLTKAIDQAVTMTGQTLLNNLLQNAPQ